MTNLPAYLESLIEIQRAANGPGEVLSFLIALRDDARRQIRTRKKSLSCLAEERDIRGRRVIRKAIPQGG